jgi:hypothetical protein
MFPSDTYPVFPVRITRPRNPPNFAAGDPNTNIVGAHVQCEKELEGTVYRDNFNCKKNETIDGMNSFFERRNEQAVDCHE